MTNWIRDWWRGWSDEDLRSVLAKVEQHKKGPPGSMIPLTNGEMRAHVAYCNEQWQLLAVGEKGDAK